MPVLLTPGVSRRPRREPQPGLQFVRTDVAGFAGISERGPLPGDVKNPQDAVVRLTSWAEYTAKFGGYIPHGYLPYAVRAFFENGGRVCHAIRVAATKDTSDQRPAAATLPLPARIREPEVEVTMDKPGARGEGITSFTVDHSVAIFPGDLIRLRAMHEGTVQHSSFTLVGSVDADGAGIKAGLDGAIHWKPDAEDLPRYLLDVYDSEFAFQAMSAGQWGNRLWLKVTPQPNSTVFSLEVFLEGPAPQRRRIAEEFFHRLSFDPETEWFVARHLARSNLVKLLNPGSERVPTVNWDVLREWAKSNGEWIRLEGGNDGPAPTSRDFTGGGDDLRGLRLLEEVDEVAILAVPDAVFREPPPQRKPVLPESHDCGSPVPADPPAPPPPSSEDEKLRTIRIYHAMLDQCERRRDRVAILDVPTVTPGEPVPLGEIEGWRETFQSRFAALYHPWLRVPALPDDPDKTHIVPPSGHVAGIYAQNDLTRGVHHPPGNLPLSFIISVAEEITEEQQQSLNPKHINAIRPFAGRGIRVWGVRALAAATDGAWRFIHVRRLVSMIEESIEKSMQWTAFEPNNDRLRRALRQSVSVFLGQIWRAGGLKGVQPEEGFYVRCDETNNPPVVVDAGQVICTIGLAITDPMEFIEVEIRHAADGAEQLTL